MARFSLFSYALGFRIHDCVLTDLFKIELPHDKTNKMTCAPSEDSDQPGHPPSLIRVFAVMKKHWARNYLLSTQWRLWSDWADAQADLSLCWGAHLILLVLSCSGSFISTLFHFSLPSCKWCNKITKLGNDLNVQNALNETGHGLECACSLWISRSF